MNMKASIKAYKLKFYTVLEKHIISTMLLKGCGLVSTWGREEETCVLSAILSLITFPASFSLCLWDRCYYLSFTVWKMEAQSSGVLSGRPRIAWMYHVSSPLIHPLPHLLASTSCLCDQVTSRTLLLPLRIQAFFFLLWPLLFFLHGLKIFCPALLMSEHSSFHSSL